MRDLEAVVQSAGLERFALFAYSAGGPTGVAYAARHPEKVTRLVLAATYAGSPSGGNPGSALRGLVDFLDAGWESPTARAAFVEFLAPEAGEVQRRVLMQMVTAAGEGPQYAAFMRAVAGIDVSEEARRLPLPTLVIASDADTTVPLEHTRELASLIPGARFEIIEGASHIGACGADPRAKRLVSDFLAEGS